MDFLSELVNDTKAKLAKVSTQLTDLNKEAEAKEQNLAELYENYDSLLKWSEIFDKSDMAVKKMVTSFIIEKVEVFRDYRLNITFNINFEQFNLGLEDIMKENVS